MNKKLMAVAVASALGAAGVSSVALAQSSTVTLSGNLNYIYGQYNNGGNGLTLSGAASTNSKLSYDAMNDSESEVVVKGEEALGGGLSTWFQCASSFDVTGNRAGAGSGGFCGRNSAIGMKGGFGNAYIGNWDTPAKMVMNNYRVFALSYPMGLGMLFNSASSDVGNQTTVTTSTQSQFVSLGGGASFSRRQQRSITYITPNFKGFVGSAGMSASNEASGASYGNTIQKPRLYSFGLNYTNGPLQLGAGYEIHKDYNPGNLAQGFTAATYQGGTDNSYQLGAGYSFMNNAVRVNLMYVRLNYQVLSGLSTNQSNWGVNGSWNIAGPHTIRLGYTQTGDTGGSYGGTGGAAGFAMVGTTLANGGAGNTGAKKYSFEYGYTLSKRTELGVGYARVNNDSGANLNVGTGATSVNFGESSSYMGLRITHKF